MAQKLAGTAGFVARHVNERRLTQFSFNMLLRVCRYLIHTKNLVLTLTARSMSEHGWDMFDVHADSSHGNAEMGRSYGGFVLLSTGSQHAEPKHSKNHTGESTRTTPSGTGGAIAWKCFAPPEGDDSSAAAELRNVTTAVKYVIMARTIQVDLDVDVSPTKPTDLYTDAQAVLDGKGGERMPKSSRWMGTRYAMVRNAENCDVIKLRKTSAADNAADIVTKCLTGAAFKINRARILGLPLPDTLKTDDEEETLTTGDDRTTSDESAAGAE